MAERAGPSDGTVITGRCLCGAVGWRFHGTIPDATICNCSARRRYAALWAYDYDGHAIHVDDPEGQLVAHMRGPRSPLTFNFCGTCGNVVSWRGRGADEEGRTRIAVNLRLGRGLIISDPEPCGCEMDGGHEVCCGLEVSGCDASEVFEAVEEALDHVSLAVEVRVDRADDANVALAGDVGCGTEGLDGLCDGASEVAAVSDHIATQPQRPDQFGCGGLVGGLAWGEHEADGQAAAVNDGMDLGTQSPTGTTDGVIRAPFLPPAACWWARTIELSSRCRLSGETWLSRSKMRSQTPCLAHRL